MDLSNPAATVLPPVTARILDTLNGTSLPLSGREIHRIAGQGSVAGVWRELSRLEAQGIVTAFRRPRLTHYMANREHLTWPAIEQLLGLRSAVVDFLRSDISGWPIPPIHASIFGSAARGDGGSESDIDLLLVREDSLALAQVEQWDAQLDQLRTRVFERTGNRCQTFGITRARFREYVQAADPLVASWKSDSVLLGGERVADLIRRA